MSAEWIFFDIGCTLVDESACYRARFREITDGTSVSYDDFERAVIDFSKYNQKGDHAAAAFYGFALPKWHKELEKPYPRTEEVLSLLKKRGYRLGVIANQSLGTKERLKDWGLLTYFDVVIASAEEGISKPDPRIFELALNQAHCRPSCAVMVGDRLDNDMVPAKKLGMITVWVKQGYNAYWIPKTEAEKPDYSICDLTELLTIDFI